MRKFRATPGTYVPWILEEKGWFFWRDAGHFFSYKELQQAVELMKGELV